MPVSIPSDPSMTYNVEQTRMFYKGGYLTLHFFLVDKGCDQFIRGYLYQTLHRVLDARSLLLEYYRKILGPVFIPSHFLFVQLVLFTQEGNDLVIRLRQLDHKSV